jgi:hypothetical protein
MGIIMAKKPFQIIPDAADPNEDPAITVDADTAARRKGSGSENAAPRPRVDPTENGASIPVGGLSDEEVRDLDALIQNLKKPSTKGDSEGSPPAPDTQIRNLESRVAEMGEMLLKFDTGLKTLFELLHLFQRKSDLLNQRIIRLEKRLHRNTGR